jgi:hypothetical protein
MVRVLKELTVRKKMTITLDETEAHDVGTLRGDPTG